LKSLTVAAGALRRSSREMSPRMQRRKPGADELVEQITKRVAARILKSAFTKK
jgi:hypothetical protein